MKGYTAVPFRSFAGGLNLRDAPDVLDESQAIDLLNVQFTERGAVRQRDGYAQLTGSQLTNRADSLGAFYKSDATKRLMVGNGNRIDVLDTSGASVANTTSPTASPHFFARFGGPTIEAIYAANGTDQVRRYDTAGGFTTPAGLSGQTGRFVAVLSPDNRLVVARESGTTAGNNQSSVNFSNPGDPEAFTAADYVDITPGDGEAIQGVCSYRNLLFVFKETKFAVFYGDQTNATGSTTFNYRLIDAGIGLVSPRALCVGKDGVYFLSRSGVYRTTGQEPELLSDIIDPFFIGGASLYFKSNVLNHGSLTSACMGWHEERLYLAVPTGSSTTNDRMLVFDPRYGWWSLYDLPASCLMPFRIGNQAELVFGGATGSKYVYRHSSLYISDAMSTTGTGGNAIAARWRSGWSDYGDRNVKTIREAMVWGAGQFAVSLSSDFDQVGQTASPIVFSSNSEPWDDDTGADAWDNDGGTDPWSVDDAIRPYLVRNAIQGPAFSAQFTNATAGTAFSIHSFIPHLREERIPSAKEAA